MIASPLAKPARGTVFLNAYHQGAQVVIEVRDDGRGMDLDRLRKQAVEKGILKSGDAKRLSEQEALNLIFEPGFSTAAEVTEVSGRGVGMDVVRSVMDKLKGTVQRSHASRPRHHHSSCARRSLWPAFKRYCFASAAVSSRFHCRPLWKLLGSARMKSTCVDQREILRLREQLLTLVRLNRLDHIHAVSTSPAKRDQFRHRDRSRRKAFRSDRRFVWLAKKNW